MAGYVPYYGKKRDRLYNLQVDLYYAVDQGADSDTITRIAEEVRAAQIRVFQAQIAQVPPTDEDDHGQIDKIRTHIEEWKNKLIDEIIVDCKKKLDK